VIAIKTKHLLIIGILLVLVGILLLAVNQIFYVSKIVALGEARLAWARNHSLGSFPSDEAYGLNQASFYISVILGSIGYILVFIGASYIIIQVLAIIIRRSRYQQNKETKQNPS
jgi:hypothetical protein